MPANPTAPPTGEALTRGIARRQFLTGGLAAIALATVAACSADTTGKPQPQSSQPTHPVVKPKVRFGLDTSVNEEHMSIGTKYKQVCAAYDGTLGAHTKFFDAGHGWAASRQNMLDMGWGSAPGENRPVICARHHDDGAFDQLMTDMAPVGDWIACFWQEVNDDIRDGQLSVSQYRSVWPRLDALRKAHPHGAKVRLVPIMNGYTVEDQAAEASAGGFDAVALCRGLPIDGIGFDVYDNQWRTPASWTPERYLAPAQHAGSVLGVPWSVSEFGLQVSRVAHDNEQGRANRLQQAIDFCTASSSFEWLNYWEGKGHGGDWSLIGTPGQEVMQTAMNNAK